MAALRRLVASLLAIAAAATAALLGWALLREGPANLPWARLDLGSSPGLFTGRALARLGGQGAQCRQLLDAAGVRYTPLPPRHAGRCGYDDALRFAGGGARRIAFSPAGVGVACPVAAALAMWEWSVVQPAARGFFGADVTRIEHLGSYNCRPIAGSGGANWSEHATANAIDIAGFRLADGTRITVSQDWRGGGQRAAFLHEVRGGACDLFATVLSPDYNVAHADHLHLDQAARGAAGWRTCR